MTQERNFLIHPQTIILTLILSSVTALFLGFSAAYLYSRLHNGLPPIELPIIFFYNSLILIASSYCLIRAKKAYLYDQTDLFKQLLWVTLVLTIMFLIAQIEAWQQLTAANVHLTSSNLASYLYVISGLHFAHVIAGIPFLGYFIWIAHKRLREPVSVLIYFSDPANKRKLKLLTTYWNYLDIRWIYLVVFFLINFWLRFY